MSTAIKLAAFAYLEPGGKNQPTCRKQDLSDLVAEFLESHVADLVEKARGERAPAAGFADGNSRSIFDHLASKGGNAFVASATEAAQALQAGMDQRAKPGLFVALKRQEKDGPAAAILKLDVVEEHAGRLAEENGRFVLRVVEDLVDRPGRLQKGAAVPDPRAGSDVIVAEKASGRASQYFLDAFGIRQMVKPAVGTVRVIEAVRRAAPKMRASIERKLEKSEATDAGELLGELEELVPKKEFAGLRAGLTDGAQPVGEILPPPEVKRILEGEGVRIEGRVSDMRKVRAKQLEGGDWKVEIAFKSEPRERFA